eukprot:1662288-Alexandrium_andersonii.AAC.1
MQPEPSDSLPVPASAAHSCRQPAALSTSPDVRPCFACPQTVRRGALRRKRMQRKFEDSQPRG